MTAASNAGAEIRAHLADCAECSAFAATLAQRPRDLAALFPVLPAPAAAAILAETTGPVDDDKRRRGFPLLVLLTALAVAATVAVAAISGGGGGGGHHSRPTASATPVRPGAAPPATSKPRRHHAPQPQPLPHKHTRHQHPAPPLTSPVSAISGYATAGERTQVALGDGCNAAAGAQSAGRSSAGSPSCAAASGSAAGTGGLPYTGFEIGVLVAIALMLLASGLVLRRIGSIRTRR